MHSDFQQILNRLASYKYGILYDDEAFVVDKEEMQKRDGTHIIVQTPQMMDQHRSGMCHDASIYVDQELTKLGIVHKCVYIASHIEPMLPTHSFVVMFDESTKNWIIIDVFASKDCIYTTETFKDLNKAIDRRTGCWIRDDNNGSANLSVFILEHLPVGGRGFLEWTQNVVDSASEYNFDHGYSHVEYEGTGIYEALKRSMSLEEWKSVLQNEDITWLPKPPGYDYRCKSYFTMKGYKQFQQKVMPIVKNYLDESKISEQYIEELDKSRIVYTDEFQTIIRTDIFNDKYSQLMKRYFK